MNPDRAFALAVACATAIALTQCTLPGLEAPHFPLRGQHVGLECGACHETQLMPLSDACQSCHEGTRPPSHYPGDCKGCHDEAGWEFAVADHSFLPLTFSHDLLCATCHTDPDAVPSDLDPACTACHDEPPSHYGEPCTGCHTWTTWDDVSHDHDVFVVPHSEDRVKACGQCHPSGVDTFVCTDCHAHQRGDMAGEHDDVGGYVYDSVACQDCHEKGFAIDD